MYKQGRKKAAAKKGNVLANMLLHHSLSLSPYCTFFTPIHFILHHQVQGPQSTILIILDSSPFPATPQLLYVVLASLQ
jgi:hypothetical protein